MIPVQSASAGRKASVEQVHCSGEYTRLQLQGEQFDRRLAVFETIFEQDWKIAPVT